MSQARCLFARQASNQAKISAETHFGYKQKSLIAKSYMHHVVRLRLATLARVAWQTIVLSGEESCVGVYPLVAFGRLSRWHQVRLAIAYQVGAAHFFEGLAQGGPVIRVVVAQKRFM